MAEGERSYFRLILISTKVYFRKLYRRGGDDFAHLRGVRCLFRNKAETYGDLLRKGKGNVSREAKAFHRVC